MWFLRKSKDLVKNVDSIIPCDHEQLHYHPYGRFFFYYFKNTQIVIVDRGFTTETGDACTTTADPTTVNHWTSSLPLSNILEMSEPAFYGGFCFIALKRDTGYSYIYRWDTTMNTAGTTFTSSWTQVKISDANRTFKYLYGMKDVGLFWIYEGQVGYYLTKISATGTETSTLTKDSTKTWRIFQTRFNNVDDVRPVYLASSDAPGNLYKATNVLTDHFTDSGNKYNFFTWPYDFGKYYAMQARPGTCAQENGGSEDHDKLHINVLSLRDKAHSICIDDSEDIYCTNGKWEPYNLEGCDHDNTANGDGCSNTCAVEPRWTCVNTLNATSSCTYVACGNSFLDAGETCDDGNTVNGDGCSSTCKVENCHKCTGVGPTSCFKACENGSIDTNVYFNNAAHTEVCDEGAASDDLGCLDCCSKIQIGYKCGTPGTECILRCGDGTLDTNTDSWGNVPEKCDDGNRVSGDGCRADCGLIEEGYECPTPGTLCNKICGNTKLDNPWTANSTSGLHFSEDCDYSKTGDNMKDTFKDPHSVCCKDCKFDYSRSERKQLGIMFSHSEATFLDQSGTYKKRNVAGASGGVEIEY